MTAIEVSGNTSEFSNDMPVVIGIEDVDEELPREFGLYQNYPNPFNPVTTIRFDLPRRARIEIVVFDALGKKVETVVSRTYPSGNRN